MHLTDKFRFNWCSLNKSLKGVTSYKNIRLVRAVVERIFIRSPDYHCKVTNMKILYCNKNVEQIN